MSPMDRDARTPAMRTATLARPVTDEHWRAPYPTRSDAEAALRRGWHPSIRPNWTPALCTNGEDHWHIVETS